VLAQMQAQAQAQLQLQLRLQLQLQLLQQHEGLAHAAPPCVEQPTPVASQPESLPASQPKREREGESGAQQLRLGDGARSSEWLHGCASASELTELLNESVAMAAGEATQPLCARVHADLPLGPTDGAPPLPQPLGLVKLSSLVSATVREQPHDSEGIAPLALGVS
jgi:hypothetical protein